MAQKPRLIARSTPSETIKLRVERRFDPKLLRNMLLAARKLSLCDFNIDPRWSGATNL